MPARTSAGNRARSARDKITAAWRHYLGSRPATPYAAPARADDLFGLPPAYIATAELCPNRGEDIDFFASFLHLDEGGRVPASQPVFDPDRDGWPQRHHVRHLEKPTGA